MSSLSGQEKGVVLPCPACGQKNRVPWDRMGDTGVCGRCGQALPALSSPVEIESEAAFQAMVQGSRLPVVVDFWAPWCGPCRIVAPEMEKVAASAQGRLLVVKVNTEALPDVAGRLGVMSIPTLAVFAGGREVSRTAGARPAAAILAFVEQALAPAGR